MGAEEAEVSSKLVLRIDAPMTAMEARARFDFQAPAYRSLFRRSHASAFQHPDWLTAFYRHIAPAHGWEPLVICCHAAGRLVLVVPLVRRRAKCGTVVEYAFGGVTDYACAIADPAWLSTTKARLAPSFAEAVGPCDRLQIEPVRQDHLQTWSALLDSVPRSLSFAAHPVSVERPFANWRRKVFSERRRSGLDRKARRLTKTASVCLEIASGPNIQEALTKLQTFRRDRFTGDPIQDEHGFRFYLEVAKRGALTGLARTYTLAHGGRTMAILFGIIDRERFCYLLLGCDYDRYERYSPGIMMLNHVMENWAENGGQVFDFTIGDEPFKRTFGCQSIPMAGFLSSLPQVRTQLVVGTSAAQ